MPWWDVYFNELYLRMSETILTPDRTAQEVAGVMTLLDLQPGARILDLCCGQGRHAVPLARAGYRMIGLDRSTYLLGRHSKADRALRCSGCAGICVGCPGKGSSTPV